MRPVGPQYSREQLEILASDKISAVLGPMFAVQDDFHRQVRMPQPPLLLADRVSGIRAEAGSLKTGTIWTETDVKYDSWYLHQGRMPAGIMVESGQADLLLISWLGADFLNQGRRVYRLLGCELTYHNGRPDDPLYHGVLPRPGETLLYDIHVDGHARQGDIRLFFFHYDCRVGPTGTDLVHAPQRLSVRKGQAGFFTDEELAGSGGVLWNPADEQLPPGRVDPPRKLTPHRTFTPDQIQAFARGDMAACFGEGFEWAKTHVRSPRIAPDNMTFMHEVTDFDPTGGPWGRGYLRVHTPVTPQDWFFDGHFKNDPCMPGTLMFEGTMQTMAFYMAALGFGLERDGWVFEPVPEEPYLMRCRGQVTPVARDLVYEVFVREVHDGSNGTGAAAWPTLYADLLCTVDGLKAFHCARMGLRLVPGFPIEAQEALAEVVDTKPVATTGDFPLGQRSLWACAWGRPSEAFGPAFLPFDGGKKLPRLPGPPYHFMSRIMHLQGELGDAKVGAAVTAEYDVPPDAWYFKENGCDTMPLCVLMEAALQPCGWLASYIGTPLRSEIELYFRNLDGTGTILAEIRPDSGVLTTRAKLTSLSNAAGMVIVAFEVDCSLNGAPGEPGAIPAYRMTTVFGFFPGKALSAQVGIVATPELKEQLALPSDFLVDLTTQPAKYCGGPARLGNDMVLMLDRVNGYWPEAGKAGLGRMRAEKDVDQSEWFFKAHFFQDPVQPGSLGIEAMCQLVQFYMLERQMGLGMRAPRFEPLAIDQPLTWKYRGQVVPTNKLISTEIEVTAAGRDDRGPFVIADATLWVDGMRIYTATGLGMRLVEGDGGGNGPGAPIEAEVIAPPVAPVPEPTPDPTPVVEAAPENVVTEFTLDPDKDLWLQDHKPTYVLPVLPFMGIVDCMATAVRAVAPGGVIAAMTDVHVQRWIALPGGPLRLRTEVAQIHGGRYAVTLSRWFAAPNPTLSRFETVATGTVILGVDYGVPPAPLPVLTEGEVLADPYGDGTLFHGPAFRILRALTMGAKGSSATVVAESGVPVGTLNTALLDGATHAIPNDDLNRWCADIVPDRVGYPSRLIDFVLYGPTPTQGRVRIEVRFDDFYTPEGATEPDMRFPAFRIQWIDGDRVWATGRLVSVLFPKGPLGNVAPALRQSFLAERIPVPNIGLSRRDGEITRLSVREVKGSDWLPGTLARLYDVAAEVANDALSLTRAIAVQEHIARRVGAHPSQVRMTADGAGGIWPGAPLSRHDVDVTVVGDEVAVIDAGPPSLDLAPVQNYWAERLAVGPWPGEDLYYGLARRYVDSVTLADPEAFEMVRGRSLLFLANHQVGIESLLASLILAGLTGVPTATLAKAEHKDSWLGRLIAHHFAYPGVADPGLIVFFDRQDPASLPGILKGLQGSLNEGGKSLLVHVDGTRALKAGQPVASISATFLDMAIAANLPVVPVRFSGGLPTEALRERLEFPVGHGKQGYHIGRPIWPDELAALPYVERKRVVLEAINSLGPTPELAGVANDGFTAEVAGYRARSNTGEVAAAMFKTLEHLKVTTPETKLVLQCVRKGQPVVLEDPEDPRGPWMAALADWLRGVTATPSARPAARRPFP